MIRSVLAASAVCLSLFAASAQAADLAVVVEDVAVVDAGFDWEGPYVGLDLGADDYGDGYVYGAADVFVGYNFLASEGFLLGIEGGVGIIADDDESYGRVFAQGRAGFLATPDVLIFGAAGVGYEWALEDANEYSDTFYLVGAGIEAAVSDAITVRGQVSGIGYFDGGDVFEAGRATVGVAFHF